MIRAVLLDLGGPVFNEDAEYAAWTDFLVAELQRTGIPVVAREFVATVEEEIVRCEPNPWSSALWRWVRPDLVRFHAILETFRARNEAFQQGLPGVAVRPEAIEVIPKLAKRYLLALAANQPPRALEILRQAGLLEHFQWREVSATLGVAKPRPLFFRIILDSLGIQPAEAVMVGDRLDHDIFPARLLGMHTIRILVGPYSHQRPPSVLHHPDLTIPDLSTLEMALWTWEEKRRLDPPGC